MLVCQIFDKFLYLCLIKIIFLDSDQSDTKKKDINLEYLEICTPNPNPDKSQKSTRENIRDSFMLISGILSIIQLKDYRSMAVSRS